MLFGPVITEGVALKSGPDDLIVFIVLSKHVMCQNAHIKQLKRVFLQIKLSFKFDPELIF